MSSEDIALSVNVRDGVTGELAEKIGQSNDQPRLRDKLVKPNMIDTNSQERMTEIFVSADIWWAGKTTSKCKSRNRG